MPWPICASICSRASSSGVTCSGLIAIDLDQVEAGLGLERADKLALGRCEDLLLERRVVLALDDALAEAAVGLGLAPVENSAATFSQFSSESSASSAAFGVGDRRLVLVDDLAYVAALGLGELLRVLLVEVLDQLLGDLGRASPMTSSLDARSLSEVSAATLAQLLLGERPTPRGSCSKPFSPPSCSLTIWSKEASTSRSVTSMPRSSASPRIQRIWIAVPRAPPARPARTAGRPRRAPPGGRALGGRQLRRPPRISASVDLAVAGRRACRRRRNRTRGRPRPRPRRRRGRPGWPTPPIATEAITNTTRKAPRTTATRRRGGWTASRTARHPTEKR